MTFNGKQLQLDAFSFCINSLETNLDFQAFIIRTNKPEDWHMHTTDCIMHYRAAKVNGCIKYDQKDRLFDPSVCCRYEMTFEQRDAMNLNDN